MTGALILLAIELYIALGIAGFIFWQRQSEDIMLSDLLACIAVGSLCGPLAWLFGWMIHTSNTPAADRVVIKKKVKHGGEQTV